MHVLPLGYRAYLDGKPNVTLQDPLSGERRGFTVTTEYFELLIAIDPTVSIPKEDARLRQLSDLGIVALLPDDVTLEELIFVPVLRSEIISQEVLDTGYYRFGFGNNKSFTVGIFGSRFLQLLDSQRTLGEIIQVVKDEDLAGEEEFAYHKQQSKAYEQSLIAEAYFLAKALIDSGAATFEVKPS